MAGHPSVKKRQKELQRKERQAEKLSRRDERRLKRGTTPAEGDEATALEATLEVAVHPEPAESADSAPAAK